MPRTDAAAAISGELFERGWSRVRGAGGGLRRQRQMVRAAVGHSPAIFKVIKKGGCHNRIQLRTQLEYLTTKSSHLFDSRGIHAGKETLTPKEIEKAADLFASRWPKHLHPKMGHTTHMLMAFPIGTSGLDVKNIAQDMCERFFQDGTSEFDFIAAVHEDRAHPHAHIILNRYSKSGEMFYLGEDHKFNYDAFRTAMVEIAEQHGVRLEATRRIERGVITYKAPIDEIYRARREGRDPEEPERTGKSLDRALVDIARYAKTYRGLALEANRSNREDLTDALAKASELLAGQISIEADGAIYMANEQSFDDLVSDFSERVQRIEEVIETTRPEDRADIERQLSDVLRSISHLNPLGDRSNALQSDPTDGGIYSARNRAADAELRLSDPKLRQDVDSILNGSGLSAPQVLSRVEVGAQNAALERQWLGDDLRRIAAEKSLDLDSRDGMRAAMDQLDDLHAKMGETLKSAGVLREDGIRATEGNRVQEVLAALRERPTADVLRDPSLGASFRQEIEAQHDEDRLDQLKAGDENALDLVAEDRLDRLYLAKTYLQSDARLAASGAVDKVLCGIAAEHVALQREQVGLKDADKGPRHG